MNTGKKASLKNEAGDRLGTIRLCCSRHCSTNGGEVKVFQRGSGEITVFTSNKRSSFHYRPGNGATTGATWSTPSGICAKATGSVTAGIGRASKGSGPHRRPATRQAELMPPCAF